MRNKHVVLVLSLILMTFTNCSKSGPIQLMMEVQPSSSISEEVPVHVDVKLPSKLRKAPTEELMVTLKSGDGENVPGQIVKNAKGEHELWWILPVTNTNEPTKWTATITHDKTPIENSFEWRDTPNEHLDLFFDGKRVLRYEYKLGSNFEKGKTLTASNKPFYHIYDLQGDNLITNGPEEGVWSHHRGIMIGWRDVGFKGEKLSFWGMEDLTVQKHIEFRKNVAGPVLAQTEAFIQWNDSNGNTIIEEVRQATIFKQSAPDILLLDYTSDLTAVGGAVTLDGNADHGGVQFRAHNDVAEDSVETNKAHYYFHQDSIDALKDFDLPWVGMRYGLNNKRYSIVQMDDLKNGQPSMWSAYRDYGRFGPFFKKELNADETLTVNYRFWMSESDMPSRDVLSSKYKTYIEPVKVKVITD
ncbi:MAG: PmoA family protein [Dysgonamonadaceae bacterium]|nr:PmoA family protein [Dysgonamonadaceae bacterium]MDD4728510.1 PmoA family protein [Dysgonamonadaceae bacterium]